MHFKTMVAVNIAPIVEDEKRNQEIRDMIQKLSDSRSEKVNHMLEWQISRLRSKVTGFSSAVDDMVSEVMEPYFQDTRNPDYLEFFDMTAELREDYNSTTDCIKLPEGKIVQLDRPPYYTNYIIQDGKVFQQQAGKLHHQKRTKKAKKIQALPQYPISSLYSSFEQYAESFGFEYDGKSKDMGITVIQTLDGTGIKLAEDGQKCSWFVQIAKSILKEKEAGVMKMLSLKLRKVTFGFLQHEKKTLTGMLCENGIIKNRLKLMKNISPCFWMEN